MQDEARKKFTTSALNEQKNSDRRNSSKQHKNWGLLVLAPLLHSSEEKSFFTELVFGLTMQKMTTYSCGNGLVNPSAESFTVQRELNSFEVISCFMDKAFNTCIELGIVPFPLGFNWLWWILHWTRVILETINPYPLPFYSHSPFKMAIQGGGSIKYF